MYTFISEKTKAIQIANTARADIEGAIARASAEDADADVITPALTAKNMNHWDKVFADLFR